MKFSTLHRFDDSKIYKIQYYRPCHFAFTLSYCKFSTGLQPEEQDVAVLHHRRERATGEDEAKLCSQIGKWSHRTTIDPHAARFDYV